MRQLAYLGVAALTAVALLGTSCSSDDEGGATATGGAVGVGGNTGAATGGASSTAATTKATGGATSASTTSAAATGGVGVGGVTSTSTGTGTKATGGATSAAGGSTAVGGSTATGGGSSAPVTGGIELTGDDGNFLEIGEYKGVVWTTSDAKGENATRTDITYSDIAIATGEICVTGTARKVPLMIGSTKDYDYSGVWGAEFGWNLNQPVDADGGAGDPMPVDVSDVESITVNFEGATSPAVPLRVQVLVPDPEGGASRTFCTSVDVANLPQTIPLTSLVMECWPGGKKSPAFDPMTMKPTNLQVQVVTDKDKEHPFNFCMTELKFNSAADAG